MTSASSRPGLRCGLVVIALSLAACAAPRPPLRVSVYAKVDSAPDKSTQAPPASADHASSDPPCRDATWTATPFVATSWPDGQTFRVGSHVALVHAFPKDLECVTLTLDAELVPATGLLGRFRDPQPKFDGRWQLRVRHLQANRLYVWSIDQFLTTSKEPFDHCHVVTRIDISCETEGVCPQHLDLPLELPDPNALDMVSDCRSP